MRLPEALGAAIEAEVAGVPAAELRRAAENLTASYRAPASRARHVATRAHRLAYAVVRAPATYAAVRTALGEVAARVPAGSVRSVLDAGAGPGVAAWAARDAFPDAERVTLVERDAALVDLGRRLAGSSLGDARWITADLERVAAFEPHDLVVASYVAGELDERAARALVARLWDAARVALVVVEPGTPRGFATVRAVRDELIARGASIAAPCPHARECPMAGDDWCHFAARVERTSLHRRVKGGDLGHEDEKYAYVAASRSAARPAVSRIVRHPRRREKYVELELCTRDGLERRVVTRGDRALYRPARKAAWGGAWDESTREKEREDS
jgi:ribosomal protein RSM22 (predicted rRNA methylase)